jgi:hypothetical protein
MPRFALQLGLRKRSVLLWLACFAGFASRMHHSALTRRERLKPVTRFIRCYEIREMEWCQAKKMRSQIFPIKEGNFWLPQRVIPRESHFSRIRGERI